MPEKAKKKSPSSRRVYEFVLFPSRTNKTDVCVREYVVCIRRLVCQAASVSARLNARNMFLQHCARNEIITSIRVTTRKIPVRLNCFEPKGVKKFRRQLHQLARRDSFDSKISSSRTGFQFKKNPHSRFILSRETSEGRKFLQNIIYYARKI